MANRHADIKGWEIDMAEAGGTISVRSPDGRKSLARFDHRRLHSDRVLYDFLANLLHAYGEVIDE